MLNNDRITPHAMDPNQETGHFERVLQDAVAGDERQGTPYEDLSYGEALEVDANRYLVKHTSLNGIDIVQRRFDVNEYTESVSQLDREKVVASRHLWLPRSVLVLNDSQNLVMTAPFGEASFEIDMDRGTWTKQTLKGAIQGRAAEVASRGAFDGAIGIESDAREYKAAGRIKVTLPDDRIVSTKRSERGISRREEDEATVWTDEQGQVSPQTAALVTGIVAQANYWLTSPAMNIEQITERRC